MNERPFHTCRRGIHGCELKGRRLARFSPQDAAGIVADRISDFSPLEYLPAFREFQADLGRALDSLTPTLNT
jgi:hypothetical protein